MFVLSPEFRIPTNSGRIDQAISKGQLVAGRLQCQRWSEIYDNTCLHLAGNLEGFVFTSLAQDFFENFVNGNDRNHKVFGIRKDVFKEICPFGIGKIFKPNRGIYDLKGAHRRSPSLSMVVSMPLMIPRSDLIGCTGMSSTRFW